MASSLVSNPPDQNFATRLDPILHVLERHGLLEKEPLVAQRYEYPLTDDGRVLLV